MAILSDLITDAYRESNLIAVGTTETPAEQAEGLKLINRFIESLFGEEAGENLQAMNVGRNNVDYDWLYFEGFEDWYIPLDTRLMLNLEDTKTLRIHPMPNDGSRLAVIDVTGNLSTYPFTLEGNGRNIEGSPTLTLNTDGFSGEWFYRDDLANWSKLTNLELTDPSPFPSEFDDMLSIGLAIRLSPRQGAAMSEESISAYNRLMRSFKSRYKQTIPKPSELALIRTPGIRWTRGFYSWPEAFNRGYPIW